MLLPGGGRGCPGSAVPPAGQWDSFPAPNGAARPIPAAGVLRHPGPEFPRPWRFRPLPAPEQWRQSGQWRPYPCSHCRQRTRWRFLRKLQAWRRRRLKGACPCFDRPKPGRQRRARPGPGRSRCRRRRSGDHSRRCGRWPRRRFSQNRWSPCLQLPQGRGRPWPPAGRFPGPRRASIFRKNRLASAPRRECGPHPGWRSLPRLRRAFHSPPCFRRRRRPPAYGTERPLRQWRSD